MSLRAARFRLLAVCFANLGAQKIPSGAVRLPIGQAQSPVLASPVSLALSPAEANVDAENSQQLVPTVTGTANTSVKWSVAPQIGHINAAGLYTAPETISAPQDVVITAYSVADPGRTATATIHVNTGVTVEMGPAGLSGVKYNGQEFLSAKDAVPQIVHLRLRDASGKTVDAPTGAVKCAAIPRDSAIACSYQWGTGVFSFHPAGNRLNISVTIRNGTQDRTIDHLWMFPIALSFPSIPHSPTPNANVAFNIDAPAAVMLRYENGAAELVGEDLVNPLATGFWPAQNPVGRKWYAMLAVDPDRIVSKSWPSVRRPIPPLASDTYELSIRFGNTSATEYLLAGDIFARYAATFPMTVKLPPVNRPIASLHLNSRHRPVFPTNPRGWFNDPTIDVITGAGIAEFQRRMMKWADESVAEMKRVGAGGGIIWDVEGQEFDAAYVGDPEQAEALAPELTGVLDAVVRRFTSAGFRIGFTLRPQVFKRASGSIDVSGKDVRWVSGAQFSPEWIAGRTDSGSIEIGNENYQIQSVASPTALTLTRSAGTGSHAPFIYSWQHNDADPGAVLKRKIAYASRRWGATLFYVDSDLTWDHTINGARYFEELQREFPDFLIAPEAKNTRHFAYSIPYNDSDRGFFGPPKETLAVYPSAITLIKVDETAASKNARELIEAVRHGSILLFDGWYRHAANDFVREVYSMPR